MNIKRKLLEIECVASVYIKMLAATNIQRYIKLVPETDAKTVWNVIGMGLRKSSLLCQTSVRLYYQDNGRTMAARKALTKVINYTFIDTA